MLSWEEVVIYFKVVSQHFPGGTEENYEKPKDQLYANILHDMDS
jgi:hypothetical protein